MRSYARRECATRSRRARGPTARGRRPACRSRTASGGSRGGTAGRTARLGRGTRGRAGRCSRRFPAYHESGLPSPSSSRKLYACHVSVGRTTATRCDPEATGRDDERREPDPSVRRVEAGEVEAARPVADRHGQRLTTRSPVDRLHGCDGDPVQLGVALGRLDLRPRLEDLDGQAPRPVADDEPCPLTGPVALSPEGGLDCGNEARVRAHVSVRRRIGASQRGGEGDSQRGRDGERAHLLIMVPRRDVLQDVGRE